MLVRLAPGIIFLTEGIQKFLFPSTLGTGRFVTIGFSHPGFWATLTGVTEIVCGSLLLMGLFARSAAIPLLVIMGVAFFTTKWPELLAKGYWVMMHDYRTDLAMMLNLVAILLAGSGTWSLEERLLGKGGRQSLSFIGLIVDLLKINR